MDIEKVTKFVEKNMPEENDRTCHQCNTTLSKEEIIKRLVEEEAKVQTFTGRLFCCDDCWTEYLKCEGFI